MFIVCHAVPCCKLFICECSLASCNFRQKLSQGLCLTVSIYSIFISCLKVGPKWVRITSQIKWKRDRSNLYIVQISMTTFFRQKSDHAKAMDFCISQLIRLPFEMGMHSNALAHATYASQDSLSQSYSPYAAFEHTNSQNS